MGIGEIEEARRRLQGRIERTPVRELPAGECPRPGIRVALKLENLQVGGAFKARGARNFLAALLERDERPPGVVTYSSGNHGRAVAEAARAEGLPAVVTVPDDVDPSKAAAMRAAGAEVVLAGCDSRSRELVARRIAAERGYAIVPPFDHEWIIAGQGTAALEIVEDFPGVVAVWVPVGGGGLAAGIAAALRERRPDVTVYAVEPAGAAPLAASLAAGERRVLSATSSVADGLLPLAVGERNWSILSEARVTPVVVEEEGILASLRRLHELGIHAEPSGAVAPAPLLFPALARHLEDLAEGLHVAVISGGNVDPARLARLLAR